MSDIGCLKQVPTSVLLTFFEESLVNISSSYNANMELYRESEKNYELAKSEIIHRFKKNN